MHAHPVSFANVIIFVAVAVHWSMTCLSEAKSLSKERRANGRLYACKPLGLEHRGVCFGLPSPQLRASIARTDNAPHGFATNGTFDDGLPNPFPLAVRISLFGENNSILRAPTSQLSFDISPNGKWLASIGDECSIWIWDLATKQVMTKLKGHNKIVSALSFSPDGKILASGSVDKTIKLWDVNKSKVLATLMKHDDEVIALAFSPDSRTLASTSVDNKTLLWEIASFRLRAVLQNDSDIARAVAFSPDGLMVASGSSHRSVKIYSTKTGMLLTTITGRGCIWALTFSPDSRTLALAGEGGKVVLWNVPASKELALIDVNSVLVTSVAFCPKGDCIAVACCEWRVILLSAKTFKLSASFLEHTKEVCCVMFSPDGSFVVSGGADCTIRLWNILDSKN